MKYQFVSRMKFHFLTDCINSTGSAITAMVEQARDISFATFARHCDWQGRAKELGYSIGAERGLHLKDDWAVSYHRSTYQGRPCYYMRWSAIEQIFVDTEAA